MLAQGIDFAFYNSTASAQDLDDLRRALGLEQWNLFRASYGTRLALTAMRDTPAGIRGFTSVLGIAFIVALGAVIVATAQDNPFLLGFGVPACAGRIFLLPWLIIVGTLGVVFFAVAAWARHWWTLASRLHYSLVALACVGLTAEILSLGLL
jgi:pimeloyl-ACP methyl ester carboxylesterase